MQATDIKAIKDSGNRTDFGTGAVRDIQKGKGRADLLPIDVMFMLAEYYEAGCQKYGDRNWEKGIPMATYMNSAFRHYFKELRGDTDENHAIAMIWNMCCYLQTKIWIEKGILPQFLRKSMPPSEAERRMMYVKSVPEPDKKIFSKEEMEAAIPPAHFEGSMLHRMQQAFLAGAEVGYQHGPGENIVLPAFEEFMEGVK